jgi:hypothetical protein
VVALYTRLVLPVTDRARRVTMRVAIGMSPRHVLTPSNGQHTPQHHHREPEQDARIPSARSTPPAERNVEAQLQEAAQSSLAHARLGGGSDSNPNQTMVA